MRVRRLFEPFLVLRNREEVDLLVSFRDTDDRSDELDQELRDLEQRGIEVIKVVENETLDMRTIVILGRASV